MYIRLCKGVKAITIDVNRRKKEVINPFNSLPNYL